MFGKLYTYKLRAKEYGSGSIPLKWASSSTQEKVQEKLRLSLMNCDHNIYSTIWCLQEVPIINNLLLLSTDLATPPPPPQQATIEWQRKSQTVGGLPTDPTTNKPGLGTIGRVGEVCTSFGTCAWWCWALEHLSCWSAAGGIDWRIL